MAKLSKTYNILIRFTILVFTFYFLYRQLFFKHDFSSFLRNTETVTQNKHFISLLLLTIFFLPINLLLESRKWQFLMQKLETISLFEAFKAVLAGISVSVFLPNRIGDYLGRVFVLKKADRLQATLATILGSMAQLLTTLVFGMTGLIFFLPQWINTQTSTGHWMLAGLIFSILFAMALLIFAFLNFSVFSDLLKRLSGRAYRKIAHYAKVFSWYHYRELLYVWILSMLRYLVFSLQFYLFLHLFDVPVRYPEAMLIISLIYLLMSIIPTIALSEIGVRGSVSLYVFGLYWQNPMDEVLKSHIVAASSALWILNLVIPALIGLLFIFKLRFFRNNKTS